MSDKPTFERAADEALDDVREIYSQRGQEYQDSWSLENMRATFTEHTLREFGITLEPDQVRLVLMAALVDVKDSRMIGPFKADSVLDGVAYRAAYLTLRSEYERKRGG